MDSNGTPCRPQYRLLTDEQIAEIHLATLEVLETVGMQVLHEDAVEMLRAGGCRVVDGNVVQFPNWLVEEAIRTAPSRITIYSRDGQEAMRLEGRNSYFGLGTDLIRTRDLATKGARPSRLQDVANAARVADYCTNVDFVASYALPYDVPTNAMYVECARTMIENTPKPFFFTAAGRADLAVIADMATAVAGGADELRRRPFLIHYSEPTAPLRISKGAVDKLLFCAERGIPICFTPGDGLAGSTPVTVAGGVIQANAEALGSIVLHQMAAKGAPIISGMALAALDMRTMTFSYGSPEWRLTNSAFADLYHHYDLPMWSTVGSDAHSLDEQAAMEHAISTLMAALDGAHLIHDVGYLGQGLLGDPAAIIMCDEIISYVKRILRGFDLSRETAAVDLMAKVGPGGTYLGEEHTVRHYRQEIWRPMYVNRDTPDIWAAKGAKRYGEIVTMKAEDVLATHEPTPLPATILIEVRRIAAEAGRDLAALSFIA
ncbi:MAG: trimethylamine methyltransferase family protein [Anaerolineae bacterium]